MAAEKSAHERPPINGLTGTTIDNNLDAGDFYDPAGNFAGEFEHPDFVRGVSIKRAQGWTCGIRTDDTNISRHGDTNCI